MGKAFRVFVSYAHADEKLWNEVEKHLAQLRNEAAIELWRDHQILPGEEWEAEIFAELNAADIVLLGVSASFLASKFCYHREMKRAIERHEAGEAKVVPILLKPCDWKTTDFAKLQALPAKAKPVSKWKHRDDAGLSIAEGLRRVIEELRAARPRRTAESTLFSVPYPRNPFFTGREDVLAKLAEQLETGGRAALSQVAAISGLGGIGKTQTAVEFAYRHREEYRKVFFVRSETEAELVTDFAAMSEKLGLPQAADQNANAQAARRWLEGNEGWLLILDNADTPALLEFFLPARGGGHVLITSRAQNWASLNLESESLAAPPIEEALGFLLKRTGRLEASAAEKKAAGDLAAELGKLPLALEQAAAYLVTRKVSFADYLKSYRKRGLELLRSAKPEAGTRHDSVEVTWSLNIEQVECESPASVDLLRAAAFCAPDAIPDELFLEGGGAISERLGKAVAGGDPLAVAELAAPLLRYSLVERDAEERTLSLHRLVQEVVIHALGEAGAQVHQGVVKALYRVSPWPEFETWPRCERLLPHVLAVAKSAEETSHLSWLLSASASFLYNRGRFAEAKPLYGRSLAILEMSLGGDHPETAGSLNNLANLYVDQGIPTEAEPLYERALAILEKSLGGEHPAVASSLNNLASLYAKLGRPSEAESLYERSVAILEKSLGSDHPETAGSLNNLAALYVGQGRSKEAEALYERALAIWEKSLGGNHPDVAGSLNNLANLFRHQGRPKEAESLYERSLAILEKSLGGDHPHVANSLNNLAALYADQGRYSDAEPLYERSLAIREKSLGGDHPDVATVLENLGILRREQGREAEADELDARARDLRARHADRNPPRDPPK